MDAPRPLWKRKHLCQLSSTQKLTIIKRIEERLWIEGKKERAELWTEFQMLRRESYHLSTLFEQFVYPYPNSLITEYSTREKKLLLTQNDHHSRNFLFTKIATFAPPHPSTGFPLWMTLDTLPSSSTDAMQDQTDKKGTTATNKLATL